MSLSVPLPTAVQLHGPRLVTARDVTGAPAAEDSAHVVTHLVGQVMEQYGGHAAFNVGSYNASQYAVSDDTPLVPVAFRDGQRKGYTPVSFLAGGELSQVAIPTGARAASGTDGHLGIVYRDQLTELWQAQRAADGTWSAVWGGAITTLHDSTGQYVGTAGVSASGLAMTAQVLGIREAQAGVIGHAVGIGVTRVVNGPASWPAVHTDGRSTAADAIHMGRVFRLRASLDLDALRWTPWPGANPRPVHPLCRMVAQAAKTYGLVVTDTSGCVSMGTESGLPTKDATGTDPWTALLAGTPAYNVLAGFPWQALECLPFDYGRPTASTP